MSAILGALKYIPASTARKALEKVNPGFKNYFAKSAAYGLDINRAVDYLADRFQSESQKAHKQHLERGEANRTLRPDEMASKSQIENAELPFKAAKTALSFVGGGLLGREGEKPQEEEKERPKSKEQAVMQYNEMQKKKRMVDQLREDFDSRYGPEGSLSRQQGSDPDMQALLQALQSLKQARGG